LADLRRGLDSKPVEDVDAERSRLQAVVPTWVQEPTNQPWGNRSMLFRDPDGNLINFFHAAAPPARVSHMNATLAILLAPGHAARVVVYVRHEP
jgi:hypothetical protein